MPLVKDRFFETLRRQWISRDSYDREFYKQPWTFTTSEANGDDKQQVAKVVVCADTGGTAVQGDVDNLADQQCQLVRRLQRKGAYNHPHICPAKVSLVNIRFFDPCIQISGVAIVTPKFDNGNILEYMKVRQDCNGLIATRLTSQVAAAVEYLHSQDTCHGNLCPNNIMINDRGIAVLTDIQTYVVSVNSRIHSRSAVIPIGPSSPYTPPEVFAAFDNSDFYQPTAAADAYAFACCAYVAYTGKGLLEDRPRRDKMYATITKDGVQPLLRKPYNMPMAVWECLGRCWDKDSKARPSMSEVKLVEDLRRCADKLLMQA
ncbi:hypothetical protein AX17_006072 [Amanita inopinata Kibby_2008]|nr:hypothetical protein AX17_006072 [Amanita inopinata Kibby_2008]